MEYLTVIDFFILGVGGAVVCISLLELVRGVLKDRRIGLAALLFSVTFIIIALLLSTMGENL